MDYGDVYMPDDYEGDDIDYVYLNHLYAYDEFEDIEDDTALS